MTLFELRAKAEALVREAEQGRARAMSAPGLIASQREALSALTELVRDLNAFSNDLIMVERIG